MFSRLCLAVALTAVPVFASAAEIVRYRAEKWQAKHLHKAEKAKTISETLTKLGCEVKKSEHNGHIDVKYRCVKWKEMKLKDHAEAHKWEKWFKEYGFETEHKH